MKSTLEVRNLAHGFDLKSYEGCMVFSDFLLDLNDPDWSYFVRILAYGGFKEKKHPFTYWLSTHFNSDMMEWFNYVTTHEYEDYSCTSLYNSWKRNNENYKWNVI